MVTGAATVEGFPDILYGIETSPQQQFTLRLHAPDPRNFTRPVDHKKLVNTMLRCSYLFPACPLLKFRWISCQHDLLLCRPPPPPRENSTPGARNSNNEPARYRIVDVTDVNPKKTYVETLARSICGPCQIGKFAFSRAQCWVECALEDGSPETFIKARKQRDTLGVKYLLA